MDGWGCCSKVVPLLFPNHNPTTDGKEMTDNGRPETMRKQK